ncbi:MAG: DUF3575 domain-containing protein [Muribaculaceae bacterium]|nr:DUF3575 domain-containing protein [Muribaculaceae bacterium]
MRKSIIILLGAVLGISISASAVEDTVAVYFHQSKINFDSEYYNNQKRLDSVLTQMQDMRGQDGRRRIRAISVSGTASPEGSLEFNRYLSERRAQVILDKFRTQISVSDSVRPQIVYLGRDWQGLMNSVAGDSLLPYRTDVINIIGEAVNGGEDNSVLRELKRLHGGVPYGYMYRRYFPVLRVSRLTVEYAPEFTPVPAVNYNISGATCVVPGTPESVDRPGDVRRCKPFYMGLKTNMLYDALLLPNIGAEFYVGKGWSVTADWLYGWWDNDRTHYYWRAYGGNVGVRKWLGKRAAEKPLTGHHIGIFGGIVTYDFELGGTGYMGGIPGGTLWDRCNYMGGIEYGYSLPVARRLNIDFSIGVGYLGGKYYKYVPKDGFYEWRSTHKLNWVGPIKAEVALVWLIGCDNYNRGGRR